MSSYEQFHLPVHIFSTDAYVAGTLLLPVRSSMSKPPRFLDVLNNPTMFLRNPGEVASDATLLLSNAVRHSFHGSAARTFKQLYVRLDAIVLGSDDAPPGALGTGMQTTPQGLPEEFELYLRGGLHVIGMLRGGTKSILHPNQAHRFIAMTSLHYSMPHAPQEQHLLGFAAVNNLAIESAVCVQDL